MRLRLHHNFLPRLLTARLLVMILAVIALSAACEAADPEAKEPTTHESADPATSHAGDVAIPTANSSHGRVTVPIYDGPLVPDPHHAESEGSRMLIAELFSGFTRFSDAGDATDATSVVNDLAESIVVSDDGTRYVFTLRSNAKFSDGSPVLASHFVWSWTRALREASASVAGNQPTTLASDSLRIIAGADAVAEGLADALPGVRAIDDRTLSVQLVSPAADFLMRMAEPVSVVLNPDNVRAWGTEFAAVRSGFVLATEKFDFETLPVGSGPFRLTDFVYDEMAYLERNDQHHLPVKLRELRFIVEDGGPVPVDGVDAGTAIASTGNLEEKLTALRTGRIDLFHALSTEDSVAAEGSRRTVLAPQPSKFVTRFMALNNSVSPLDDEETRNLLSAAWPVDVYAGILADPIPSGVAPANLGAFTGLRYDTDDPFPAALRELDMNAASRSGPIRAYLETDPGVSEHPWDQVAAVYRQYSGLEFALTRVTASEYAALRSSGRLQVVTFQVQARRPDPLHLLEPIVGAFGDEPPSPEYATFEDLIGRAQAELDPARRIALIEEAEAVLRTHSLVVPVSWRIDPQFVVVSNHVRGYRIPRFHGSRFRDVWTAEP